MALRYDFPPAENPSYLDGVCDGWEYRVSFSGASLSKTYEMVRSFLEEEGYEDIPIPTNHEELLCFRLASKNQQLLMFEDNGYVHNPIKILFPQPRTMKNKNMLILCLYNEEYPQHLLKFHKREHLLKKSVIK